MDTDEESEPDREVVLRPDSVCRDVPACYSAESQPRQEWPIFLFPRPPKWFGKTTQHLHFFYFLYFRFLHILPRDAMHKRGLCCRPVSNRLSVCLSVRYVGALYPDG